MHFVSVGGGVIGCGDIRWFGADVVVVMFWRGAGGLNGRVELIERLGG